MANVKDVSECILKKTGSISTWKLQKLVYYAQAWHTVWNETPLFDSKIEAWANGPVCRDLYDIHKGKFSITTLGGDDSRLSRVERENVAKVVDFYNGFNGQQLSDLTHNEDPWKNAREGMTPGERGNKEITLEAMNEYYSGLS